MLRKQLITRAEKHTVVENQVLPRKELFKALLPRKELFNMSNLHLAQTQEVENQSSEGGKDIETVRT